MDRYPCPRWRRTILPPGVCPGPGIGYRDRLSSTGRRWQVSCDTGRRCPVRLTRPGWAPWTIPLRPAGPSGVSIRNCFVSPCEFQVFTLIMPAHCPSIWKQRCVYTCLHPYRNRKKSFPFRKQRSRIQISNSQWQRQIWRGSDQL